ncbi:translation initiation factor IF-2-like [Haliotis rufescens]|uniref:translation initiation factor IF-2-like n=1 Tax=Haliotis rufescens TaxID=6454 RepID=UPI00201EFFD3|nr:translation initiation factor IF-2-like [Haliotis rufescens]
MGSSRATILILAVLSCVCGQNAPPTGVSTNPMAGLSRYLEQLRLAAQLQAGRQASQSGQTGQGMGQAPSMSSMGTSGMMPTNGGMPMGGMPSNGGMPMGGMPSNGGMPMGGNGGMSMGGMPSNGGMPMGGMPSNGGMSMRGMPSNGGMSMGGVPSNGAMPMGGMPSNGGMSMGGMPSNGGMPMGGMPSNGGMSMGGMPSNGGMSMGGMPSNGGMSMGGMPSNGGIPMGMGTNSRMSMPGPMSGMSPMGSAGMSMGRMSMPGGLTGGSMASFMSSMGGAGAPGAGRSMMRNSRLMMQVSLYERKRTLLKNVIKLYENHGCIDPVQKLPDGSLSSMAMSAGCANSPIANLTCSRYAINKLGATNVLAQSAMPAVQQNMYVSRLQGLSPYNMFNDYLVGRNTRGRMNPAIFRMVNGPEGLGTGPAFSGERLDMIKNTRMRLLPYQCQDIGAANLNMGICCPGPVSFDPQLEMLVLSDLVHT